MASKLVEQADLDAAQASLDAALIEADDCELECALADTLVECGKLTRYQADQLLKGVTRFQLGKYRITGPIGQGGMGQVFLAEHAIMGRHVAIKVLPKHKSTPETVASFNNEIRALAALDHKNLVRAFDAGFDGNVYFLVTEYVPGSDLRRLVRSRGPLSMADAATIISQAAEGLQHAHARGLIHRDVKPGNLLVTPEGLTKVSDLGLAGSLDGTYEDPRAGKVVGTADYLSPEQVLAPRNLTPGSDIYSLGCTLYYAVTGKVPYPGGSSKEKARRHCHDSPINPRVLNSALSPEFIDVIAAMMQKEASARLADAQQVINRLQPWAGGAIRPLSEADCQLDPAAAATPLVIAGSEMADTAEAFDELLSQQPLPHLAPENPLDGTESISAFGQETVAHGELVKKQPMMLPDWVFYAAPIVLVTICLAVAMITWAVMR